MDYETTIFHKPHEYEILNRKTTIINMHSVHTQYSSENILLIVYILYSNASLNATVYTMVFWRSK